MHETVQEQQDLSYSLFQRKNHVVLTYGSKDMRAFVKDVTEKASVQKRTSTR